MSSASEIKEGEYYALKVMNSFCCFCDL